MADYTNPVRDKLNEHGWSFHRHGKGSHDIWIKQSTGVTVSVSKNIKSKHTANGILKKAGINQKF